MNFNEVDKNSIDIHSLKCLLSSVILGGGGGYSTVVTPGLVRS